MAVYQSPTDAPNLLKNEALQMSLTFVRTGPTTGRLSWNIPMPSTGCSEDQLAYDGMVITFGTVASSSSTIPTNTLTYLSDGTASTSLHAGDKIGAALVVGALYNDKVTTEIDILDIPTNTPLYFSGYPVDKQLRYYRGGVHAYSMPYGTESTNRREKLPAYQMVLVGLIDDTSLFDINLFVMGGGLATGANLGDSTGLATDTSYAFKVYIGKQDEEPDLITINGADAQTYGDLVDALNAQFKLLENVPVSATKPNVNGLYLNVSGNTVYVWNGDEHVSQSTIPFATDPSVIALGEYWFKPSVQALTRWNGSSWDTINYVSSEINPSTELAQTTYWFDGSLIHKWNGVVWCEVETYVQSTNPSLPVYPEAGSYWFNTDTSVMYEWDVTCNGWGSVEVIYAPTDPNDITNGDYWFNPDTNVLSVNNGSAWDVYGNDVVISTTAPSPTLGMAWFNPNTDVLQIYNGSWNTYNVTVYHLDPTDRTSCQMWWNSLTDELSVWTFTSPNGWVEVNSFVQSATDPAEAPTITVGSAWYNNGILQIWDEIDWIEKSVIVKNTSPNHPSVNDVWYKQSTNTFYSWKGSSWVSFTPFYNEYDRSVITAGTYWHNISNNAVSLWNGMAWVSVMVQTTPYTPAVGYSYFNTVDQELYTWSDAGWIIGEGPARVILNQQGNLVFLTRDVGSEAYIALKDVSLFLSLVDPAYIKPPETGRDEIPDIQGYAIEGVGTDGSTDERKALHQYVLQYLGAPDIAVELTNDQLDTCIRKALEEFRLRSSSAYKRGFFFLNITPGKQIYELSDKTVGFNKITRVMGTYRIQSSFLGNATGQGAYGQAMLQHLYQMGSFDLVSYHIMSDYVELMNMMFAANLMFTFDEDTRKLYFHQNFGSNEKVLLDVIVERTEQDLMKDRMTKVWIERFVLGKAMLMLAEKRGKYSTIAGAGGGISLNAADLRTSGQEMMDRCFAEIDDYISSEIEMIGFGADFVMG